MKMENIFAGTLLCGTGLFLIGFIGMNISAEPRLKREKEAAEAQRKANPPDAEVYLLNDDAGIPFKVYGLHDRQSGDDHLLVIYKDRVIAIQRGDKGQWTMPGDPTRVVDHRGTPPVVIQGGKVVISPPEENFAQ